MFDFFNMIIGYLEQIWTMVVNNINMTITLVKTTLAITSVPAVIVTFMPGAIAISVIAVVSFGVVKLLLGR